ncbi:hypothetical protein BJ508DRAFT_357465 [Ascobolus immersus RN42]|uniref:Uncharacterized protein n=1 Tax=Ascobolus immersus RN42 TaxID=1160509 RepID=A0A3N4ILJ0_ASCIM|nr:hypothetical protein BJ508DRAFT_357465 [Ascobolus immersus RN42]
MRPLLRLPTRRFFSSTPPSGSPPPPPSSFSRLPPSLQRYAAALRTAPVTHITSFLILHELTAIIPLFSLTYFLHVSGFGGTVLGWFPEERVARMKGYLVKKRDRDGWGWLGDIEGEEGGKGGKGGWVVEILASYALVKAAIPARIAVSLWATPWFAGRVVGPVGGWVGRLRGRGGGGGIGGSGGSGKV